MGGWRRSCALADLPGDVLALVADALALVGLRRPLLADVGGELADLLLGVALDDHARGLGHLELDALRRLDGHGVRVAELELEVLALQRGAVADTLDLERLREAGRDALDHVGDQRARQPVQGAVLAAVGGAGDEQLAILLLDADVAVLAFGQVAARTDHADDLGLHGDGHAVGNGDGLAADTTHGCLPDLRHDLAADARLAGIVAGQDARGRGDDRGAHAALDLADPVGRGVVALARARDAAQALDGRPAVLGGIELDADDLAGWGGGRRLHLVAVDVALLLEDPGHLDLQLGRGD